MCKRYTFYHTHTQQYTPLPTQTHTLYCCCTIDLVAASTTLPPSTIFTIKLYILYKYILYIQQSPPNQSTDYLPKKTLDNKLNLKQLKQVPNPAVLIVSMKRKRLFKTKSNRNRNNQRLTNCSFLFTLFYVSK